MSNVRYPVTVADLETRYPEVDWRVPLTMTVIGHGPVYVCRVCVARNGLPELDELARTPEAFLDHWLQEHEWR